MLHSGGVIGFAVALNAVYITYYTYPHSWCGMMKMTGNMGKFVTKRESDWLSEKSMSLL